MPLTNPSSGADPTPPEEAVTAYAAAYLFAESFHPGQVARGVGLTSASYDAIGMFWLVITSEIPNPLDVVIAATVESNDVPSITLAVVNAAEPNQWNVFAYDSETKAPVATPNISVSWSLMTTPTAFP